MSAELPGQLQLQYARQPASSLASCQYRGDGGVIIVIPPMVHRTMCKIALAVACAGVVIGTLLFVATFAGPLQGVRELPVLASLIALPSLACLCVIFWMGLRWTTIEAGPEGLRLELRGVLRTRRWFIAREKIGRLRHLVSIWVVDARGWPRRRIDGADRTEDAWLMEVLSRALAIPPPLSSS